MGEPWMALSLAHTKHAREEVPLTVFRMNTQGQTHCKFFISWLSILLILFIDLMLTRCYLNESVFEKKLPK